MFRSIELFKAFGIPIRVHTTLPIFMIVAGLFLQGPLGFAGVILLMALIFSFVLLHELGHSVVALHHGIPVRQITLYPLGGVASIARIPRRPRVELEITIAGPLVNFLLAGVFWLLSVFVPGYFVVALMEINLILGLFNLLPAFPMDGGRILRALLAMRMPYLRATERAVKVGRFCAILMGLYGLFAFQPMLLLIAVFVYFAAQAELQAVTMQSSHPGGLESFAGGFDDRDRGWRSRLTAGSRPGPFWAGYWQFGRGLSDSAGSPFDTRPAGGRRPKRDSTARDPDASDVIIEVLPDGTVRKYLRG